MSRLIDADKLPIAKEYCIDEAGFGASFYVVHKSDIDKAPTIEQPAWIPVTERLPNVDKTDDYHERVGVAVCIRGKSESEYRYYRRSTVEGNTSYHWTYPWGDASYEKITHWMPLPQPPKEGE